MLLSGECVLGDSLRGHFNCPVADMSVDGCRGTFLVRAKILGRVYTLSDDLRQNRRDNGFMGVMEQLCLLVQNCLNLL